MRLTAQVQGLGPRFRIKLSVQNTGRKTVSDLVCTLNYNAMLCAFAPAPRLLLRRARRFRTTFPRAAGTS